MNLIRATRKGQTVRTVRECVRTILSYILLESAVQALQPLSPPPSPRSLRSSIRSSSSSAVSFNLSFEQLPSEVFQVCKERVQTLLRDYDRSQSTVAELSDSQSALKKAVEDHEEQIRSLQADRAQYASQLDSARIDLAHVQQELRSKTDSIWELEAAKALAEKDLQNLRGQVDNLQESSNHDETRTKSLEGQLSTVQAEWESGRAQLTELQGILVAKQSAIAEYKDQVVNLQTSGQDSLERLDAAHAQIQVLQAESDKIQAALAESRDAHRRLEDEKKTMEKEHAALKTDWEDMKGKLHELKIESEAIGDARSRILQELRKQQDALQASGEAEQSLKTTIQEHEHTIQSLERAHHILQDDFNATRSMLANFAQTAARLRRQLKSEKQRSHSLSMSESVLKSTVRDFEQQNIHLQQTVDDLVSQLSLERNSQQAASKIQDDLQLKLEKAKEMLWNARNEYEDKIGALIAAEVLLRGELEEMESRSRSTKGAKADVGFSVEKHNAEVEGLKREHEDKLGAYLSTEVLLRADLDAALSRSRAADDAKARLESALEEMKASAERSGAENHKRLAELQEEHTMVSQELKYVQSNYDTLKAANTTLELELESECDRKARLQGQLDDNEARTSELEAVIAKSEKETSRLRTTIDELEQAKAELQKDIETARRISEDSRTEFKSLQRDHEELRAQFQDASASGHELDDELAAVRLSSYDLTTEIERLRPELFAALESRDLLRESSTSAEARITKLQHQIATYEAELVDTQHREAEGRKRLSAVEAVKTSLENELAEAESSMWTLRSQRSELDDQLSYLQVAKNQLEGDLHSSRHDFRETQNDNATLKEELERLQNTTKSLQIRLDESEAASERLEEELQSARHGLQKAEEQVRCVERQLKTSKDRIATLEAENKTLMEEREEQSRQIQSLESQHHHTIGELAAAVEVKDALAKQLQEHQESIASLESQYQNTLNRLDSAVETNASLSAKIDERNNAMRSLETDNRNLAAVAEARSVEQTTENDKMIAALQALEAENQLMKKENMSLQEKLRRSQAIRTSHETALGNVRLRLGTSKMSQRNIQSKLRAAQQGLGDLAKQNNELEAALTATLASLDDAYSDKDRHMHSLQRVKELESTIAELKQQNLDGQTQFETAISAMTTELEAAKKNANTKDLESSQRLQGLQQLLEEMKQEKLDGERKAEATLAAAYADLEIEKRKGIDSDSEASSQIQTLEARVDELHSERQDLQEQLSATQTTVSVLEEALKRSQEDSVSLKAEVSRLADTVREFEDQVPVLKQQLEKSKAAHGSDLKKLRDEESRISNLQKENAEIVARLEADLGLMNNLHVSDIEAVRVKEELIASLTEENQQLLLESKASKNAAAAKENEIATLAQQLQSLQSMYRDSSLATDDHDQDMNPKDATIAALRAQIENQRRLVSDSYTRTSELEDDLAASASRGERLRQLNKDYASLVSSLQAEVRDLRLSKERLTATVKDLQDKKGAPGSETLHRPKSAPMLSFEPPSPIEESKLEEGTNEKAKHLEPEDIEPSSDYEIGAVDASPSTGDHRRTTMSSANTRVDSSYSDRSLKAYRILGAEAAAGRLGSLRANNTAETASTAAATRMNADDDAKSEMKTKLWDLWEEQQQRAPVVYASAKQNGDHTEEEDGVGELRSHTPLGLKRSRRKLQKKRRVVSDGASSRVEIEGPGDTVLGVQREHEHEHEHGRLWNFVRHGSLRRAARDRNARPITRG